VLPLHEPLRSSAFKNQINRFLNAIAITTTLILAQSCSLLPKAEEKAIPINTHHHEEHISNLN